MRVRIVCSVQAEDPDVPESRRCIERERERMLPAIAVRGRGRMAGAEEWEGRGHAGRDRVMAKSVGTWRAAKISHAT